MIGAAEITFDESGTKQVKDLYPTLRQLQAEDPQ